MKVRIDPIPSSLCALLIWCSLEVAYSQADCPYPTEFHASESEALDPEDPTSLCMYPCPGPVYTEEEWDAMFIVINVFSSISLVLSVFYVVTAALNPDTRQFPANLVPLLCAASIPVTLGMMLGLFAGGMRNVLCSEDGEYQAVGQGDAGGLACVLQGCAAKNSTVNPLHSHPGMLIVFGGLWAGSLWPIVGINLVLMVVVKIKQETLAKLKHLYHLIFWSIPTVMTIIPLAANKISASPTLPWCFVYDKDNDWWTYGVGLLSNRTCFYLPGIFFPSMFKVRSPILCLLTFASILQRTYKFNLQGNMPLQQFIRILVLLGIYWLMGASIIVYRFYGSAIKEKVQDSIEDQARTECELEEKPSYGMTLFNSIVMSSIGFCVFFAVGCSEKTFRYWQSLIRGLLHANGNEERWNVLRAHTQKREWTRRRTLSKTRRDQQGSKANHFGNSSSSTLGSEETASSSASLSMKELGDEEADGSQGALPELFFITRVQVAGPACNQDLVHEGA
ncbi:G-protein coupled receptor Fz Smo [Balamuthia mandrillaris]